MILAVFKESGRMYDASYYNTPEFEIIIYKIGRTNTEIKEKLLNNV